jgi:hypothetical protein
MPSGNPEDSSEHLSQVKIDFVFDPDRIPLRFRGYSSAGRALAWHARGQRFDPAYLHQFKKSRFIRVVSRLIGSKSISVRNLVLVHSR